MQNEQRPDTVRPPSVVFEVLVFVLVLDVPLGNLADEATPVRMAGSEAVAMLAKLVEMAVDVLAAKLAVMVAGGDGLLTEGGGDTAVVLAHGASLSEMQLHLKEAVVVFNL